MKISHIALACALAAGGSAALAQNESVNKPNPNGSMSASEFGNKAKRGAHKVGDATRHAWNKVKGKAHDAEDRHEARADDHDTRAMGAARHDRMDRAHDRMQDRMADPVDTSSSRQQRMDDAYANYKNKQS